MEMDSKKHMVTFSMEQGKEIIRVGLHDTPTEPLDIILPQLIPMLEMYVHKHPERRILIHCQAGMSCDCITCTIAIHFISYSISLDATKTAHDSTE